MWVQSLGREEPLKEENVNPLQCSCLKNPMDRGAWRATVLKVAKNQIQLSDYACTSTSLQFSSVQFICSVVSDSLQHHGLQYSTPGSLSITNSRSLLKHMSIESMMPSNHLILCRPLLPPSIFPSIRVFSNESALNIRWPKYWRFY